jgi:hypothetical protein
MVGFSTPRASFEEQPIVLSVAAGAGVTDTIVPSPPGRLALGLLTICGHTRRGDVFE